MTDDYTIGKPFQAAKLPPVDITLSCDVMLRRPRISPRHILAFGLACTRALLIIRFFSLESVIRRLDRRRSHKTKSRPPETEFVQDLGAIFYRLRSFTYTSTDRCLLTALAMVFFMNEFGVSPTWIVGVATDPFRAHSWVQYKYLVFDERPDRIEYITPILSV
jgi:hypothetical protein